MNKARKRRQRRRERDLRWALRGETTSGRHRHKKVVGVPEEAGKAHQAFWCRDKDEQPLISRIYYRHHGLPLLATTPVGY